MSFTDFRNTYLNRVEMLEANLTTYADNDDLFSYCILIEFPATAKNKRVVTDGENGYKLFTDTKEAKEHIATLPKSKGVKYSLITIKQLIEIEANLLLQQMQDDFKYNVECCKMVTDLYGEDKLEFASIYWNEWNKDDKTDFIKFLHNANYCINRLNAFIEKVEKELWKK